MQHTPELSQILSENPSESKTESKTESKPRTKEKGLDGTALSTRLHTPSSKNPVMYSQKKRYWAEKVA